MTLISTIRDLHRRRARERRALTLAEGVRLIEEALTAGVPVRGAAVSPVLEATTRGATLKQRLARSGVALEAVSDDELDRLAETDHPQGVIAVIEPRMWTLADIGLAADAVVVVLDGVQDPGNVGALARTALGLGAAGLIALPGTAELANPKALRGGMGALFRLPSVPVGIAEFLSWAHQAGVELWTTAAGAAPLGQARPAGPMALILGNEGSGVRAELTAAARRSVAVPLAGGVESLNVAVAAGIILYEVRRDA